MSAPRELPRELRRQLSRKHAGDGDTCGGCGRAYTDGEVLAIGRKPGRSGLIQVGKCCARRLASIVAGSVYVTAPPGGFPPGVPLHVAQNNLWQKDDRAWFAAHPDRAHRLRPVLRGENTAGNSRETHVAVRQLEAGKRFRLGFTAPPDMPAGEAPEDVAWAIFDLLWDAKQRGEREVVVGSDAVSERMRLLSKGGRA